MMLDLCAAYSQAAQTGRITPALSAILERSSPKAVVGDITAPTLLVQGEKDTLFGLDQADANARAIAANGTTVAVTWYNGGHDGGSPDAATESRITEWFQHYLAGTGPVPDNSFRYTVDGPISDTGRARSRTLEVPEYPGLAAGSSTNRIDIPVSGDAQFVVNPPGASPANISSLPGLSGLASTALSTLVGGLPGQTARFESAPFDALALITGTARITVTVSRIPVPGSPTRHRRRGCGAVRLAVQGLRGRHPVARRRRGRSDPDDRPAGGRHPGDRDRRPAGHRTAGGSRDRRSRSHCPPPTRRSPGRPHRRPTGSPSPTAPCRA